jgi:hypothetical protein
MSKQTETPTPTPTPIPVVNNLLTLATAVNVAKKGKKGIKTLSCAVPSSVADAMLLMYPNCTKHAQATKSCILMAIGSSPLFTNEEKNAMAIEISAMKDK